MLEIKNVNTQSRIFADADYNGRKRQNIDVKVYEWITP